MVMNIARSGLSADFMEDYSLMTGTAIASIICLSIAIILFIVKVILSVKEEELAGFGVSFLMIIFIVAGVICLLIPNANIVKHSDSRNQQISSILLEKYGAELIEPIYTYQERGTIDDVIGRKHEIWNAEGQSQTISIKLTKDKKDLIASTGGGELPKLDKSDKSHEVKPIN